MPQGIISFKISRESFSLPHLRTPGSRFQLAATRVIIIAMIKRCLIIFAKEPREGRVKTRLLSVLTQKQSLDLCKAFVRDTLDIVRKVKTDQRIVAFDCDEGAPAFLKKMAPDFLMMKQKGRTLGDRLHNAFLSQAGTGKKIVIIGSDAPTLPAKRIEDAFIKLKKADLGLGPAFDGGYYLVGLEKPRKRLFQGIRWSSSGVLRQTVVKAKKIGLSVGLLKEWYDVDDRKSLTFLMKDLKRGGSFFAKHTSRVAGTFAGALSEASREVGPGTHGT
jgi:hypothetical protein